MSQIEDLAGHAQMYQERSLVQADQKEFAATVSPPDLTLFQAFPEEALRLPAQHFGAAEMNGLDPVTGDILFHHGSDGFDFRQLRHYLYQVQGLVGKNDIHSNLDGRDPNPWPAPGFF